MNWSSHICLLISLHSYYIDFFRGCMGQSLTSIYNFIFSSLRHTGTGMQFYFERPSSHEIGTEKQTSGRIYKFWKVFISSKLLRSEHLKDYIPLFNKKLKNLTVWAFIWKQIIYCNLLVILPKCQWGILLILSLCFKLAFMVKDITVFWQVWPQPAIS